MRRLGKILFGAITVAMIGGTGLSANTTIFQAAGESYDTALEASYGDTFRSVYENRLAGSPLEAEKDDGSQRCIVVNAAVWKNHKNALKNLLAKYEKGEGWKGVSYNGEKHYENKT